MGTYAAHAAKLEKERNRYREALGKIAASAKKCGCAYCKPYGKIAREALNPERMI